MPFCAIVSAIQPGEFTLSTDQKTKKSTIKLTTKVGDTAPESRTLSTRAKEAARRTRRSLADKNTAEPSNLTVAGKPKLNTVNYQPQSSAKPRPTPAGQRSAPIAVRRDYAPQIVEPPKPQAAQRKPDGTIRVSKLLSEQGLCSRREADSYIARGWVWADGVRVTELGTRVLPSAKLKLDQAAAAMQESRVTILLNKPIGYVSGQAEDGYEPASVLATAEHQVVTDSVRYRPEFRRGLAPAGRLDIDSTGLLVLTQDGRIAKHLIGENSNVEKEYLVRVEGTLDREGLAMLNHGLSLDGEALRPAKVRWQNEDQLNFILVEGKKRQIRRMCELVGLHVIGLKRIRIGNVKLGDLPVGKWRLLGDDEMF
jgi:23S rRNA pseudouridine2604 synthase